MTIRRVAFSVLLSTATPMAAQAGASDDHAAVARDRSATFVPSRWVPGWLMDSLSRAIADATDPRDRHKRTKTPPDARPPLTGRDG